MEEPVKQALSTHDALEAEKEKQAKIDRIAPWMWKKGQSGNPNGRPKGFSLKEWTRERLEAMTDEERDAFLEGIPKSEIWKMSEGNPHSTSDAKLEVTLPTPILGGITNVVQSNDSTSQDKPVA